MRPKALWPGDSTPKSESRRRPNRNHPNPRKSPSRAGEWGSKSSKSQTSNAQRRSGAVGFDVWSFSGAWNFSARFLPASAQLLELLAARSDLETVRLHRKTEPMANLVLQPFDLVAVELHNLFAVLADDVIVVRMLGVIGVVKLMILAKIHFADQPALGQQRQRAIHRRAR